MASAKLQIEDTDFERNMQGNAMFVGIEGNAIVVAGRGPSIGNKQGVCFVWPSPAPAP